MAVQQTAVDYFSDNDSGYCDSDAGSTALVDESIYRYRKCYGRTYHNYTGAHYVKPNDAQAQESLDIGHEMYKLLHNGKLHSAPIESNPKKVVDVGTGTGIWVIEFADQFPSTKTIGRDISPIQPQLVPANAWFEIDDANLIWTDERNSFDLVHIRDLSSSISNYPKLYSEVFEVTAKGGFLEHIETNIQIKSDLGIGPEHILSQWTAPFHTFVVARMKGLMEDAGFVNVVEKTYKVPIGEWSSDPNLKELGWWNRLFHLHDLDGSASFVFMEEMKWSAEEFAVLLAKVRAALLNDQLRLYSEVSVIYGQKPVAG